MALYREVVIIVDRINLEGVPAVAHMIKLIGTTPTKEDLYAEVAIGRV